MIIVSKSKKPVIKPSESTSSEPAQATTIQIKRVKPRPIALQTPINLKPLVDPDKLEEQEQGIKKPVRVCPDCNNPIYHRIMDHSKMCKKFNIDFPAGNYYMCYKCRFPKIAVIRETNRHYDVAKKTIIPHQAILTHDEVVKRIRDINNWNYVIAGRDKAKTKGFVGPQYILKYQAMLALTYLTAARIEEIVGMPDPDYKFRDGKYIVEPIRKKQITFFERAKDYIDDNGAPARKMVRYMKVNDMPILKRRGAKFYKKDEDREVSVTPLRNVLINCEKEAELINMIESFLRYKQPDDILFPTTYQNAWRISVFYTKFYNHYWRHARLTHLASMYDFNDTALRIFVGWAGNAMAAKYVRGMTDEEMIMKMG